MKPYYIHVKSWIHVAMTCYGYSKKDAVIRFKKQHGIIRMPAYSIWEC
jgi:hypothetical protein